MSENCPKCNTSLIPLYDCHPMVSTDYMEQAYNDYRLYGYWCPYCEKMYEKHHKSWLEPWKFQSSASTANSEEK